MVLYKVFTVLHSLHHSSACQKGINSRSQDRVCKSGYLGRGGYIRRHKPCYEMITILLPDTAPSELSQYSLPRLQ